MRTIEVREPLRVVAIQAIAGLVVTLAFTFVSVEQGFAALLGGCAIILPSLWLAWTIERVDKQSVVLLLSMTRFVLFLIAFGLVLFAFDPKLFGFFCAAAVTFLIERIAPIAITVMGDMK